MRKRVASLRADDAGRSVYAQGEHERKTAEQGPSNREGQYSPWKKKGKKDGKLRRIGGGLEAEGEGRGGGRGVKGVPGVAAESERCQREVEPEEGRKVDGWVGGPEGWGGQGLRGWKTHPFSCLPSLAV